MKVKVYSTPICPECKVVKSFLEALNVDFEEVNAAKDPKIAEFIEKKTGQRRVPVVEADNQFIVGFDQEAIKRALNLSK